MPNPIPGELRRWLYLLGSVASFTAGSGVLPVDGIRLVAFAAGLLGLLAAANVTLPPKA